MTMANQQAPGADVSRTPVSTHRIQKAKTKVVQVISQNIRGLKSNDRIEELTLSLKNRDIFAACLQETWRTGKEAIDCNSYKIILSGKERQLSNRGSEGVGIALSTKAVDGWKAAGCEIHRISSRVMAVRLLLTDRHPNDVGVFVISSYAPIGVASDIEWEIFFDSLDKCISKKKPKDILIIGSDTNSSMGCNTQLNKGYPIGKFGLEHINDSGRRFSSYLAINNLLAATTCFRKNSYATWTHPRSKLKHQIDHFLVQKDNFKFVMDAGVTEPLIDSDHIAIKCKLRLIVRLKKKTTPRQRLVQLDYSRLKTPDERNNFCLRVKELYDNDNNHQNTYSKVAEAITKTSHELLPRAKKPSPGWFQAAQDKLLPLIDERNKALMRKIDRPLRSTVKKLQTVRKRLKKAVSKAKNEWILAQCNELNRVPKEGTKRFWDTVNKLKSGLTKVKNSNERSMKKPDGTLCKSPEENANVFRDHFQQLYGRTPVFDASVLNSLDRKETVIGIDHRPDDGEIRKAIRNLKERAPGDSGITPQIWKALSENESTFDIVRTIIHNFWDSENPPSEWETGLLKILPKKGDLSLPGNYRGIMLLESAYKIIAIILHNRLSPIVETLDHEPQCGFRPGRGCVDSIFTVKMAMKKRREHGQETWILFLDLVKAFDRVPRELLWEVLNIFGVPDKLLRLLKALHANVEVKFVVNDITKRIESIIGVKQGDILGPLLFIFYLAAVMISWRTTHTREVCIFHTKFDDILTGRRPSTKKCEQFSLPDSEYADDTGVLFTSRSSVETHLPPLVNHFLRFGLEIHVGTEEKSSKSEILFVAAPNRIYTDPLSFDNTNLGNVKIDDVSHMPIVDCFCYLGSMLSRDCKDILDVDSRIKAASSAFGALRNCLFTSTNVSFAAKRSVYEGLILFILLYGSEHWCLTEMFYRKLRVFHARCVRSICRVNLQHVRSQRISTDELLERTGLLSIDVYVTRRQLRWLGHVTRMPTDRLPRKMLTCWVNERRPRGAPEFTYGRGIYKSLKKVGLAKCEWYGKALNRVEWKNVIDSYI